MSLQLLLTAMIYFHFFVHYKKVFPVISAACVLWLISDSHYEMTLSYSNSSPVSHSPLCLLHEQTAAAAGRWWCPGCKWGHTGSRSAASSKYCRGSGRGRPSAQVWTTRSSSTPERPKTSTARTLGLRRMKRRGWRAVREIEKLFSIHRTTIICC